MIRTWLGFVDDRQPTRPVRRIPPFFDPIVLFEEQEERNDPAGETAAPAEPAVVQLPKPLSPLDDVLSDPEDEPLDLPAEEQAMHVEES